MAGALQVVWSLRERGWFVSPPGRPGEWVRVHHHLAANASDRELLAAVRGMFMSSDARGAQFRRLAPTLRLPKGPVDEQGHDTR
jgi:hypothetical protein